MDGFSDKVSFIWSVADLLRGDYKAHEYGQVILPLTVLRRLDATLAPTKAAALARDAELEHQAARTERNGLLDLRVMRPRKPVCTVFHGRPRSPRFAPLAGTLRACRP
jgi:hypothetical protein